MQMVLPLTFTFAALCAIAMMVLVGWVGVKRGAINVLRGDGGDPVLFKRIRIHGNFIETAPLAILCMGAAETLGAGPAWLWASLASYGAGRILHVMIYDLKSRAVALTLTTGPFLLLGVYVLYRLWLD
ncbi:MAG: MAPEG family protein [Rhizobiaceae bacterium]